MNNDDKAHGGTKQRRGAETERHGMSRSREYRIWVSAIRRCTDPKDQGFSRYGARGVTFCAEWQTSFLAFYRHIGPRPSLQHSIDRIDGTRGYEPGNVRWATPAQQAANRRRPSRQLPEPLISIDGVTRPLLEWACINGIPKDRVYRRIKILGWSVERAVSEPVHKEFCNHAGRRGTLGQHHDATFNSAG